MRLPWPAVAAGSVLVVVGAAGLIRGAVPQPIASGGVSSASPPIVVSGAYIRPPVPPTQLAAAYFTVYNTTGTEDTLLSVISGAGATAVLHTIVDGVMTAISGGLVIPAHGSLLLSTGTGHVMIGDLFGPLTPGQSVNLDLMFAKAGSIVVSAPVIPFGAPAPTGSTSGTQGGASLAPTTTGARK